MSKRNSCDTGVLHTKDVKRRVKNEPSTISNPEVIIIKWENGFPIITTDFFIYIQSLKNLFEKNRDENPASQVVQLNHGENFSEDTTEVL